jgi:hypothetical protein
MADQWYVGRHTPSGEQKSGPMSLEQLQQLAATRQLGPTDLVFREGTANWVPASSVPELTGHFPAAAPTSAAAAPFDYGRQPPSYPPQKSSVPTVLIILGVVFGGLALMCIIGVAAITMVGQNASQTFSSVGNKLEKGGPANTTPTKYNRFDFEFLVNNETKKAVRDALGEPTRKESARGEVQNVWVYENRITDGSTARLRFENDRVAEVTYRP